MARKNESFTQKVKNEIINVKDTNLCCQRAELAAIIHLRGFITMQGKMPVLHIMIDSNAVARYVFKLIKELVMTSPEVLHQKNREQPHSRFIVKVSDEAAVKKILGYLGVKEKDVFMGIPQVNEELLKDHCCQRSYLRGAFLAGGSLNSPDAEYHLEIYSEYEVYAHSLAEMLKEFGLQVKFRQRSNGYYVYTKNAESVIEFLRIIKAHPSVLYMEDKRVMKSLKNHTNRLVNCETANIDKISEAAHRQLQSIETIERTVGLSHLSPSLRVAAEARRNYPEVSLSELAQLIEPPVSKSGMSYRMRRINKIAEDLEKH